MKKRKEKETQSTFFWFACRRRVVCQTSNLWDRQRVRVPWVGKKYHARMVWNGTYRHRSQIIITIITLG